MNKYFAMFLMALLGSNIYAGDGNEDEIESIKAEIKEREDKEKKSEKQEKKDDKKSSSDNKEKKKDSSDDGSSSDKDQSSSKDEKKSKDEKTSKDSDDSDKKDEKNEKGDDEKMEKGRSSKNKRGSRTKKLEQQRSEDKEEDKRSERKDRKNNTSTANYGDLGDLWPEESGDRSRDSGHEPAKKHNHDHGEYSVAQVSAEIAQDVAAGKEALAKEMASQAQAPQTQQMIIESVKKLASVQAVSEATHSTVENVENKVAVLNQSVKGQIAALTGTLAALSEGLKNAQEELREKIDKIEKIAIKHSSTTEETKATVDGLLSELTGGTPQSFQPAGVSKIDPTSHPTGK